MKEIPLSRGLVALVDDEDYDSLAEYRWYATDHGYAQRKAGFKNSYMHREIMGNPEGLQVDHIDGNRLNNTRANLRIVSLKDNRKNSGIRADNTSGYKGVSWDRKNKKWKVFIAVNGRSHFIGRFTDKKVAAFAYNEAAIEHYGQFARLNEIKEDAS